MAVRNDLIGILGGTFDPIHSGHIALAEAAIEALALDKVYFVPAVSPPHKSRERITDFASRVEMVRLSIAGKSRFELSLVEAAENISFTYETLAFFAKQGYGRDKLHLLIGSDSFAEMNAWREPDRIFATATIVVLERPLFESPPCLRKGAAVVWIRTRKYDISSSNIRCLRRDGRSIHGLVPDAVERFIEEHSLYIS